MEIFRPSESHHAQSNQLEDDLYFEMEFQPGEKENTPSVCSPSPSPSKSVSSLSSFRDDRRGSSVGPILERPKYLSLTSRLKNDYRSSGSSSLPRIPKLSFSHHRSVPTTPAGDSWQEQDQDSLRRKDYMSSSSSVEEITGGGSVIKKTRSRLSLNLGVFDASPVRSPKIIPKFLRSSFTKLISKEWMRKEEHPSPNPSPPGSPPTSPRTSPPSSPSTRSFVRDSLAQGLPIIPFNYPTFVILEKQRENKRLMGSRTGESASEPTSRKISQVNKDSDHSGQEKSLNKLLVEAKKQLEIEKEAMKRKVTTARLIRGYAANNSRALFRRRSSITDYVSLGRDQESQDSPDTFSQNLQAMEEGDVEKYENAGGAGTNLCDPDCEEQSNNCKDDYLDMNYGSKH